MYFGLQNNKRLLTYFAATVGRAAGEGTNTWDGDQVLAPPGAMGTAKRFMEWWDIIPDWKIFDGKLHLKSIHPFCYLNACVQFLMFLTYAIFHAIWRMPPFWNKIYWIWIWNPLWKILEKCTTEGMYIFKCTNHLCNFEKRFITEGVNTSFGSAKWAYLLEIYTPPPPIGDVSLILHRGHVELKWSCPFDGKLIISVHPLYSTYTTKLDLHKLCSFWHVYFSF